MRTIAVVLSLLALLAATPALARPDARKMTCAALNALIQREGAIVLTTGEYTYERFVASSDFCDSFQPRAAPVYQLTADERRCVVYSVCADALIEDDMFD